MWWKNKSIVAFLYILVAAMAFAGKWEGRVVSVSDGDTVKILRGREEVKVRLYGVDCPESKQSFGQAAKRFTLEAAAQQVVEVEEKDTDRYGRTVGVVTLPDGRNLNLELVKAGYAWWYRDYAKDDRALAQAEFDARTAKRGLWADPDPQPPWEFRKERR